MRTASIFILLLMHSVGIAEECKLRRPIDIGTNDPRVSWVWDKRITLVDVKLDPTPEFDDYSKHNPPATNVIAVELYQLDNVCSNSGLGAGIGLTADCRRAVPEGAWTPESCIVDFLEFGRMGFSHRYEGSSAQCSVENRTENGVHTYSTRLEDRFGVDAVRATVVDKKLVALEIETGETTYCVREGRRAQPRYYKKR